MAEGESSGRPAVSPDASGPPFSATEAPFIRAPESARTVFAVTALAACGPLAAGIVLFGWQIGRAHV